MDVIGETSVLITSQAQTFHWPGHGLKLHIPEGALPAGLEECKILIKVGLYGQFELPENTSLVSAVYWLDCEPQCKFFPPLTLEIQHCAKSSQMSRLRFARCIQNSPPYTFEILAGGEFSSQSAYGCIQLRSFSLVTQLLSRLPGLAGILGEEIKYRARLYYLMRGVDRREIHFLITKDLETHATVCSNLPYACTLHIFDYYIAGMCTSQEIQQKYAGRGAIIGPDLPLEFESDSIKLQMTTDENTHNDGWNIVPLFATVVRYLLPVHLLACSD